MPLISNLHLTMFCIFFHTRCASIEQSNVKLTTVQLQKRKNNSIKSVRDGGQHAARDAAAHTGHLPRHLRSMGRGE